MTPTNIRQKLVAYMARYGFTPEMCQDKTADHLALTNLDTADAGRAWRRCEAIEIVQLGDMEELVTELRHVN
jgi:hypothetical protein